MRQHHQSMKLVDRPAFEGYLQLLSIIGIAALGTWLLIAALGRVADLAVVDVRQAYPFLLAILTLLVPSVLYPEIRHWPYRHLSAAQRLGLDDSDAG